MYSPSSDSSSSEASVATSYSSWSPSSSKTNSPVHAASLVDPSTHSHELLKLVEVDLSRPVIQYLVDCVSETVEYALARSGVTPSRGRSSYRAKFTTFVSSVLSRAEVSASDVLVALVYLARARPHLSIALEEWALERVFLGALITASKYTNDSTLRNVHWALCTGVFGKRDVGRIEREFLEVLDWELGVSEDDLLAHHEGIMRAAAGGDSRLLLKVVNADPLPLPRHKRHASSASSSSSSSVAAAGCPDLEPSSPHSSIGSVSPPTPPSHAAFPDSVPVPIPIDDLDLPVLPSAVPAKKCHSRLHTFLHSLPIPMPRHHNHHHSHHSHHAPSRPVHVTAAA